MKRVLVIGDDKEESALAISVLGKEYEMHCAYSENEAYKVLCSNTPDIILLDTYVPPASGLSVLKRIRERSCIPVIVVSSSSSKETILNIWRAGANLFLEKPLDYENLLEEMEELLMRKKMEPPSNFRSKFSFVSLSGKYRPEIVRVIQYIEKSFNKDVSLTKLSKVANITPSYLSRTFRSNTGYTINDFISRYRVNMANELFSIGMSVREAAFKVGYNDEKYFSKVYKKINGFPPRTQKIVVRNTAVLKENYLH